MKSRLFASAVVALVLSGLSLAPAALARSAKKATTHYYLALGDSLSVGWQPNAFGVGRETDLGYANDLFTYETKRIRNLKLVEMGCPGDTTESMLTGKGNASNAKANHCDRSGGSQLKAAEKFLAAHHAKGEVALVTVDIGANDVDGCANEPTLVAVGTCVENGEAAINKNLPKILDGIKSAAAKGTTLAGMNLYDPVLAYELSSNSSQAELGSASLSFLKGINGDIANDDAKAGFKTADVADAFDTYDTTGHVSYNGGTIPVDVARICDLTWMCAPPPVGPNIHANDNGYQVIADTFEKTLR